MIVVAKLNVMTVGVGQRAESLAELPVRVISMQHGSNAVRSFKTEQIDSVISHWHLDDMPDGMFLKRLRAIRPYMPTIAVVEAGNAEQEIAARSLGVTAVIADDSSEEFFRVVVCQTLGVVPAEVEGLYAVKEV